MSHPHAIFRCLSVVRERASTKIKLANVWQSHFTLVFPSDHHDVDGIKSGRDYEIKLSEVQQEKTFTHRITELDLDLNPELADHGLKPGDEVEVPVEEPYFDPVLDNNDEEEKSPVQEPILQDDPDVPDTNINTTSESLAESNSKPLLDEIGQLPMDEVLDVSQKDLEELRVYPETSPKKVMEQFEKTVGDQHNKPNAGPGKPNADPGR